MFTAEQTKKLQVLGALVSAHLYRNDKRVVNAIQEAFTVLQAQYSSSKKSAIFAREFKKQFGFSCADAFREFVIACFNTAQYKRGLEVCDVVEAWGLIPKQDVQSERAELFGRLGEFKKAEALLSTALVEAPDNIWNYIRFGDLYFSWQVLPEQQDLHRAEEWFYKAYDRGMAADKNGGETLLDLLGDVCVERLRRKAEKLLLQLLEEWHIGRYLTFEAFKRGVYMRGPDSVVFQHLQVEILDKISNHEKANDALRILNNAYNLMPQRSLNELCPFQMSEYYSTAEHSARILSEKLEAYAVAVKSGVIPPIVGAEGAEAFSNFQYEFMEGADTVTGKIRQKVVTAEYKKIDKAIQNGTFMWTGFVKYRGIDELF